SHQGDCLLSQERVVAHHNGSGRQLKRRERAIGETQRTVTRLIAKALPDPCRYKILRQIGAGNGAVASIQMSKAEVVVLRHFQALSRSIIEGPGLFDLIPKTLQVFSSRSISPTRGGTAVLLNKSTLARSGSRARSFQAPVPQLQNPMVVAVGYVQ